MAGVDMNQAQQIVGKQGKFEIRIQTTGNETEHVLYGDTITSVQVPSKDTSGNWGVGFTLAMRVPRHSEMRPSSTAQQQIPLTINLAMILDNKTVYSAPLSSNLASSLQSETTRSMIASTGTGTFRDAAGNQPRDQAFVTVRSRSMYRSQDPVRHPRHFVPTTWRCA